MNWSNVKLILVREVRDQLRDRRTLFMIAVLPLLLYPLLGMSFMQVAQFSAKTIRRGCWWSAGSRWPICRIWWRRGQGKRLAATRQRSARLTPQPRTPNPFTSPRRGRSRMKRMPRHQAQRNWPELTSPSCSMSMLNRPPIFFTAATKMRLILRRSAEHEER